MLRSSLQRCCNKNYKKGVLKIFCNIHEKTHVLDCLFNKAAGMKAFNFIKKRLQHRCFPLNIEKILRTPTLKNTSGRLLLHTVSYSGENDENKHIYVYM